MTDRIQRMHAALKVDKYPIVSERYRIIIESWLKHDGYAPVLKYAHINADYLDQRTIYIDKDELLVGNVASVPMGMEAGVRGKFYSDAEIDELTKGVYKISDEDRKIIRSYDFFWDQNMRGRNEWQGSFYDDERLWPFIRSGILCPPWKDKSVGRGGGSAGYGWSTGIGLGFFVPDYGKIITDGIRHTIEEAREEYRTIRYVGEQAQTAFDKAQFLQATEVALSAVCRLYHRYGDACYTEAEKADVTPERKAELLDMGERCHWLAEHGARDFRDAMQAFWFYWILTAHGTNPGGRFDQFMYPFYKKDKEAGKITDDQVVELLECLRIKIMQMNFLTGGAMQQQKGAGMARWHNFMIGGVDKDGKDATNELTYLVLKAAAELRTPQYTITLRVNEDTPDDLMLEAMKVVRTGVGMPSFVSDKSYIKGLTDQGVPLEDARNFALAGCLDLNIPGKSRMNAVGMFLAPKVLEICMNNGRMVETGEQLGPITGEMADFNSFEDFYNAYKEQLYYFQGLYAEEHNILARITREIHPDVLHSAFAYEGIKIGRDISNRKMPYENSSMLNIVGMVNVINSMAAIKKVVFTDKLCTMGELFKALQANWEGYEDLHQACLNAPKYGNNIDFVDSIAADLYNTWAEGAKTYNSIYGEPCRVTGISITAHAPGGSYTMATPDGRMNGETFADGVASPAQGTDVNGPIASLTSAMKIDQDQYNAMLLNMKVSPTCLKTDEDLMKLAHMVKTYLLNGGKQIQFNVVDNETLEAAKREPEKYRDLVVRVAGYSAYFTMLTPRVQDEIIKRTTVTL